ASVLGATGMTLCVRFLTPDLHTAMLAFLRALLGLAVLGPFLIGTRKGPPIQFTAWPLHVARGICFAIALNLGFYALWQLPLATATVLMFLAPVFVTVLAGPVLGERVGPRRWAAVAAGFLGAVILLRPGAGNLDWGALAAIVSSLVFALALLIGKILAPKDGTGSIFVSSTVLIAVFTLPPALFVWEIPLRWEQWALIVALVLTSSLRSYADIRAYAAGEAGFLAPFSYLRLILVGIAGYWLFGEVLDGPTWLGGAIIVGATLYIAWREARLGKRRGAQPE
ncbi:MAG: DMT family transporter, partial [Pseudomonadota bacterium]